MLTGGRDNPIWLELVDTVNRLSGEFDGPADTLDRLANHFLWSGTPTAWIPLRVDQQGLLPAIPCCTIPQVERLFGGPSSVRKEHFRFLCEIAIWLRELGNARLLIGGSFVTAVLEPRDLDIAVLVPDLHKHVHAGSASAVALLRLASFKNAANYLFVETSETNWWGWWRLFRQLK